jgi:hypothetical protein
MFRCKGCKAKDEEIQYLRGMLKDAQDRIMAFSESSLDRYELKKAHDETVEAPKMLGVMGMIESVEATTPEEQKQKEQAQDELRQIMGH